MKRTISIILSVLLTIGMFSAVSVFAAGDAVTVTSKSGTTANYASLKAALDAVADGDTVKLNADVTEAEAILVEKSGINITLDGNGKTLNITASGDFPFEFDTESSTISVKNLKIVSPKCGISFGANSDAAHKSTLNMTNVTVNAGANGVSYLAFWDVNIDGCSFTTVTTGINANAKGAKGESAAGHNNVVIKNTNVVSSKGYGIYARMSSQFEISKTKVEVTGNSGIQIVTATSADVGSTVNLKNVDVIGHSAYCVVTNPFNTIYIDGGNYTNDHDATINVAGDGCYCEIKSGTFTNSKLCVARAYKGTANLKINGGTFVFDADGVKGSAIRGGTSNDAGKIDINGGTFVSNGISPVINGAHANSEINIVNAIIRNSGDADIQAYAQTGTKGSASIDFPQGVKAVEVKNSKVLSDIPAQTTAESAVTSEEPAVSSEPAESSEPVNSEAADASEVPGDDTAVPGDDTSVSVGEDTSVFAGDDTSVPSSGDTSSAAASATTAGGDTTESEEDKGCGSAVLTSAIVAALIGTALVIRKKED